MPAKAKSGLPGTKKTGLIMKGKSKKRQALLHKKVAILLMHRPFFIALVPRPEIG